MLLKNGACCSGIGCGILKGENMLRIMGVVVPSAWDESGRVIAVTILTHDEDEFQVENVGKGKELKAFVRENVEVMGTVQPHEGVKLIQVKKYRLRKEFEQQLLR